MELLILYAVLAIFFSFMCSILEAAFLSFTPSYLKIKLREGKAYAHTLTKFKQDVDKPLIAILTLNTIAHTVGAILVGVQAKVTYSELYGAQEHTFLGISFTEDLMVGVVSTIMTILILVASEIIPKTIGATYWKSLGGFTATSLKAFVFPLKYTGVLWLMMLTTKLIGKSAHVSSMSREEFMAITDVAEEEGVFEEQETTVIRNMLLFKKVKAKDVMTPFSVAVTEDENTTIEQFHREHRNLKFSRIPVYHKNHNNITGFVLKDDILEEMLDQKGPEPLKILRRDIPMTSEDTPIPQLFERFIRERTHLAMVVDHYGNTIGLVTMEDIIETLMGLEIMDESDSVEDMQVLARQNWEKRAKKLGLLKQDQPEDKDSRDE